MPTHSQLALELFRLLLQRFQLRALPLGRAGRVGELREAVQCFLQLGDFLRHLVYLGVMENYINRQGHGCRGKLPDISKP